ncbi:MAG: MFS transporter [Rhodospirillaceae bacterium]|nr:MFS transporter [Rhodospirillaceae bacterium]
MPIDLIDSRIAWARLWAALGIAVMGGIGLWSPVVVLPTIEAEFGIGRGDATLPYTATMIGFALGGVLMGRFSDRFGIFWPIVFGTVMLAGGFALASLSTAYWQIVAIQAGIIGLLGCSPTFGPLVADISHWFLRRRGIAIAIVASGNYLAGTIWPPFLQFMIDGLGWRQTYLVLGILCLVTMLPLALLLRRRVVLDPPPAPLAGQGKPASDSRLLPLPSRHLQLILMLAGLACCVAMAMPQVHMIAYCGDLGYGPARGAEMLSLMLGFGVVSRLASGLIADKIGGVGTLILGSALQCLALLFYLPFDGLTSLYIVSALFGLSQGGIVPSYALIVRDYFPAREAGTRVSLVLTATVIGMALGGWLSGVIFDLTGSYQAAFAHGIAWNFLNMGIALWLLAGRRRLRLAAA